MHTPPTPSAPLRIAYLTSCRELLRHERVGRRVKDADTGEDFGYRASLLESLCTEIERGDEPFLYRLEVCCAIHDDTAAEVTDEERERLRPGRLPTIHRVSSAAVRAAPPAERQRRRQEHELRLVALLERERIDLAVCDSYMLLIGPTLLRGFRGTLLNVHPGITDPNDPGRLVGGAPTRDAYTRAAHGFVIVDDKRAVPHPAGFPVTVEFEGRMRGAVAVERLARTGVTVHEVTEQVDAGPIFAAAAYNFDPARVTQERIRHWNYTLKLPVLEVALKLILASL